MLSVHGKNGMHLIFLGNLVLKCFLQESQDIQPYSDNQIKEIEKRCIQNSEHMEISPAYVGCKALNQDIWGICKSQQWKNYFFSEEFLTLSTAAEQLEFVRRKLKVEREIVNQISSLTVGQRNNPSWHLVRKGRLTANNSGTVINA